MSKKEHSGVFTGFDDKVTTTLDPCDDIETAGEELAAEAAAQAGAEAELDEGDLRDFDPCLECGRTLTRLADWIPAPATREDAWEGWVRSCVATQSSLWQWCPRTGWLTARMRVHWPKETRKTTRTTTRTPPPLAVTPPPSSTARTSKLDLTSQTADTAVGYH